MIPSCYVAAPFRDADVIRESIHPRVRDIGMTPTSSWAETATGPEDFSRYSPTAIRQVAARNDADLRGSHVLLVVDLDGKGRETYAELRVALEWGKACVFLGRPALSSFRSGVVLASDLDHAIRILACMRDLLAEGYRGTLLAHLASEVA